MCSISGFCSIAHLGLIFFFFVLGLVVGSGGASVDADNSKAAGMALRVKKRLTKLTKSSSEIPWGKLLSQCSQAGVTSFSVLLAKPAPSFLKIFCMKTYMSFLIICISNDFSFQE